MHAPWTRRNIPLLFLPVLLIGALGAPAAGDTRAPVKARTAATESDRRPNDETDPARQQRYEKRRAAMVEARHLGRRLAELGRQLKDPLPLLGAAQIFQQTPPPRPLTQHGDGRGTEATEGDTTAVQIQIPSRTAAAPLPPSVHDAPEPGDLLAEARAMITAQGSPHDVVALLDQLTSAEVVLRGAALGPQQGCDNLSPGIKLVYKLLYNGEERAVLAVANEDPGELMVRITDEDGHVIRQGRDRVLLSWYPRWRGVFSVELLNRSKDRVHFCLETN